MKIPELYQLYKQSFLVDTDTRKIRENSLFFALKGNNFNGNQFAKTALNKGASYCIIDEEQFYIDERTIVVNNSLQTLQELANYHRNQLTIPIIALTGSNGKTTTKELINIVLGTQYKTTATQGNLNNHIGVPLSILSITNETEIAIIEMGANHQKEIEFLSGIAEPDYGYITNFGKAHLEGFGGVEGVIKGKSELYEYLLKNQKVVFVNPNDDIQMKKTTRHKRILLSKDSASLIKSDPFLQLNYTGDKINTQLVGTYNFINILAAISIGEYFNVSKVNIIKAIEAYAPNNNRSQLIRTKNNTILLDAYNANPSSVELALQNFNQIQHSKKVVILGDMFELGEDAHKEHQYIVDIVDDLSFEDVFFIGENYSLTTTSSTFSKLPDFISYLKNHPINNSYILIKGSRGMTLEKLLDVIN